MADEHLIVVLHHIMFTGVGNDQILIFLNSRQSVDGSYGVASTLDTASGGGWC